MNDDLFQSALAAVRAAGDDDAGPIAQATRARVRESLDVRAHHHHRVVRVATVLVVLLVTSAAWAWSTGRLERALAPFRDAAVAAPAQEPPPPPPPSAIERRRVAVVAEAPAPPPPAEPIVEPAPIEAVAPPPAPRVVVPSPIEVLYRKAHALHFHGSDHAATLAAWDAYLAAEPTGRFAIEARYNRALVLVRLGRHAEARAALAPFARGEVAGAYRQREAAAIVDRLDALNDRARCGDYGPC